MTVRVVLVDDQTLVRAGFRMVIDAQDDLRVVGEAGDGAEALRLLRTTEADVVIMDIRMPIMDGVAATRELRSAGLTPRVLVLTTFDTESDAFAALQAGASGFLLKNAMPEELLNAVRVIAGGHAVVAPYLTRRILDRFAHQLMSFEPGQEVLARLTEREHQVLSLVARGMSNAEISGELHLAEPTVKTHVGRLLDKLGLRDRVQIVVFAYESGLIRPGPILEGGSPGEG